MSVWTHVLGSIRLDGMGVTPEVVEKIQAIIGNPEGEEEFQGVTDTRPTGSEGSFECYVINHTPNKLNFATLVFVGDLRDFDDIMAVKWWFEKVLREIGSTAHGLDNVWVRQTALTVYSENGASVNYVGYDTNGMWTYLDEDWD